MGEFLKNIDFSRQVIVDVKGQQQNSRCPKTNVRLHAELPSCKHAFFRTPCMFMIKQSIKKSCFVIVLIYLSFSLLRLRLSFFSCT